MAAQQPSDRTKEERMMRQIDALQQVHIGLVASKVTQEQAHSWYHLSLSLETGPARIR